MKKATFIQQFKGYSKQQRVGLLLLVVMLLVFQGFFWLSKFSPEKENLNEKRKWLAMQLQMDSLKLISATNANKVKLYPFNPNFITDFKGYKLGLSTQEIDRLLAYRKQNKFVNSAQEFQEVTKVSDSLLHKIAPYFKFPDWVNKQAAYNYKDKKSVAFENKKTEKIDVNAATKEELMGVFGIGEGLSTRILDYKSKLGAFASMEQMNDVWGLSDEVVKKLNEKFYVKDISTIKKIKINSASVKELAQFPYFRYALAKEIVLYRSMNNDIKIEDLAKIKGFPVEKSNIIALYLEF